LKASARSVFIQLLVGILSPAPGKCKPGKRLCTLTTMTGICSSDSCFLAEKFIHIVIHQYLAKQDVTMFLVMVHLLFCQFHCIRHRLCFLFLKQNFPCPLLLEAAGRQPGDKVALGEHKDRQDGKDRKERAREH